ncbi:MAG: ribosome silencing factor [Alphaproteobacteria bacterium]|nr:ribosome silencing factor [Alphaproteobacteria bacterium]
MTDTLVQDSTKSNATDPAAVLTLVREILEDHKAEETVVIDLQGKSTIGDYMVIASGNSSRQVVALAEHIVQSLKKRGLPTVKPEGIRQGDWVLVDAGNVIVHLFRPEVRDFYNLEKMWEVDLTESDINTTTH